MRMSLTEFLTNGDLKFVIILYILLAVSIFYFVKKLQQKEAQEFYNKKLQKLFKWVLILSVFSLFLGLLHSFYFIANANGIAPNMLFRGLSNMMITPTLGIAIAIIINLLTISLKTKNN